MREQDLLGYAIVPMCDLLQAMSHSSGVEYKLLAAKKQAGHVTEIPNARIMIHPAILPLTQQQQANAAYASQTGQLSLTTGLSAGLNTTWKPLSSSQQHQSIA